MTNRVRLIACAGFLLLSLDAADAHFRLVQPPSWLSTENGGRGPVPCGEGTPSGIVTKVQGGHPFLVKLVETFNHPGHYRIALSVNSRDELPVDPDVVADERGIALSAAIDPRPAMPVLADGLFVHTNDPHETPREVEIMMPNIDCARCTLQVIQFMARHPKYPDGGYFYHHCADLQIVKDPSV